MRKKNAMFDAKHYQMRKKNTMFDAKHIKCERKIQCLMEKQYMTLGPKLFFRNKMALARRTKVVQTNP